MDSEYARMEYIVKYKVFKYLKCRRINAANRTSQNKRTQKSNKNITSDHFSC